MGAELDAGNSPSAERVHAIVVKRGHDLPLGVIKRDVRTVEEENTFIRDLSISSLSNKVESMVGTLDWVHQQAADMSKRETRTVRKQVKKDTKGAGTIEVTRTNDGINAKSRLLHLIVDTVNAKHGIITGTSLAISSANTQELWSKAKQEIDRLKKENRKLKATPLPIESEEKVDEDTTTGVEKEPTPEHTAPYTEEDNDGYDLE